MNLGTKTLNVHLLMCWTWLHTPLLIIAQKPAHILCSMCTHTLTHFEMMPGADAEFEDQYSVILSALFDIHSHNRLNP